MSALQEGICLRFHRSESAFVVFVRDSSDFYLKSTQFAIYSCNRIIHIVSHASPLQSHFVECKEFPVACDYCQLIMPNRKSVSLYIHLCGLYILMTCIVL